jgi:hypothetical protein
VQMVGHDQSQFDPPSTLCMVKCHRLKQLACHCWIVQRCLASLFAVDRDEKNVASSGTQTGGQCDCHLA